MWPFRRKKRSSRENLKQVYYYQEDFITLKALSKQSNKSMTQLAHDILCIYLGYKHGTAVLDTKELELKLNVLATDYKKKRDELNLYKTRFGEIVA